MLSGQPPRCRLRSDEVKLCGADGWCCRRRRLAEVLEIAAQARVLLSHALMLLAHRRREPVEGRSHCGVAHHRRRVAGEAHRPHEAKVMSYRQTVDYEIPT